MANVKKINIAPAYFDKITEGFEISREIKVAVDAKDSVASLFLPEFLEKIGIERSETDADFCVSFDADGDRLKIFDETGDEIRGDLVGGIIADIYLEKGDTMLADIVSSRALEERFKEKGIEFGWTPVGHYFIKKVMRDKDAIFASEMSGHYYFKYFHYAESAFFAMRLLLEALDKNHSSKISDLAKPFLKYFHSGEIGLPLSSREEWVIVLEKAKEKYKNGQQSFEDGILVEYPSWWFNLRPSNTEPIMKLVIEAETQKLLEQKKKELLTLL